jgi:dsRNA-specific ribonuclease
MIFLISQIFINNYSLLTYMDIQKIEKVLKYTFSEPSLLRMAFTHSSFANEKNTHSNESLEFFGDSVLSLIISEYLYTNCNSTEGDMSVLRSQIVSEKPLARAIDELGLIDFLLCGVGESRQKEKPQSIRADLYEAIVGAIYLDSSDLYQAERFVLRTLKPTINEAFCKRNTLQAMENTLPKSKKHKRNKKRTNGKSAAGLTNGDNAVGSLVAVHENENEPTAPSPLVQERISSTVPVCHDTIKKNSKLRELLKERKQKKQNASKRQQNEKNKGKKAKATNNDKSEPTDENSEKQNQKEHAFVDYKTVLQKLAHKKDLSISYKTEPIGGTAHEPIFESKIILNGNCISREQATRKKDAEQAAAKEAVAVLT